MKLKVSTESLRDGLRKVLSVVSTRSTMPVLSNVMLTVGEGKLTLTTTDLEVAITTSMDAVIEQDGITTLPAKKFGEIVSTFSGSEVAIETEEDLTTHLHCGNALFKIMGMSHAEFPIEPALPDDHKLEFPRIELGRTLRKIAYAVSSDQTRYVLNGILLSMREGNFTAVATDGRRLALVEKILENAENAFEGDVILPAKVVGELQKLLDGEGNVTLRISDSQASFSIDNTVLTTKLLEGNYPNYRQVIPASFANSVILPRSTFAEVLHRVSVVVTDDSSSIKFSLTNNSVLLNASSSEVGESSEPFEISYEGPELHIAFNPQYLREPLKNLDCDEITLRFNDEYKPVVILGDEGFLYVIMPMRN